MRLSAASYYPLSINDAFRTCVRSFSLITKFEWWGGEAGGTGYYRKAAARTYTENASKVGGGNFEILMVDGDLPSVFDGKSQREKCGGNLTDRKQTLLRLFFTCYCMEIVNKIVFTIGTRITECYLFCYSSNDCSIY